MQETDIYAYEEEEERKALLKSLHQPMKTWYSSEYCYKIKEKFGDFPQFWQDLLTWTHQRTVKKLYLLVLDRNLTNTEIDESLMETLLNGDNNINFEENNKENSNPSYGDNDNENIQSKNIENTKEATEADISNTTEEKKKKRKSRWGDMATDVFPNTEQQQPVSQLPPPSVETKSLDNLESSEDADDASKKPRKSRWSSATTTSNPTATLTSPLGPVALTPEVVQHTLVLQMQLKQYNDKLLTVVQDALEREQDPERSPSPPPRYDTQGKRTNTREVRMREALIANRTKVIEEMMRLNPLFQPPADFVKPKPFRRLYIPLRENPLYNFIGLIIGPRGNTQKRMERETGCKISIRGKGSIKEGSKGRAAKNIIDEDEDLHVYVTGDEEDKVEMAAKMVQELLVPVDDERNEHKQKQLRELALINGTLREEDFCTVCGEKGHRQFECPHRAKTFKAAGVKCAICGDQSHPTRDCPFKMEAPTNTVALDDEYNSFMAELGEGGGGGGSANGTSTGATTGDGKTVDANAAPPKKQQTIIHIGQVMTGNSPPPLPLSMLNGSSTNTGGVHYTQPTYAGFPNQAGYMNPMSMPIPGLGYAGMPSVFMPPPPPQPIFTSTLHTSSQPPPPWTVPSPSGMSNGTASVAPSNGTNTAMPPPISGMSLPMSSYSQQLQSTPSLLDSSTTAAALSQPPLQIQQQSLPPVAPVQYYYPPQQYYGQPVPQPFPLPPAQQQQIPLYPTSYPQQYLPPNMQQQQQFQQQQQQLPQAQTISYQPPPPQPIQQQPLPPVDSDQLQQQFQQYLYSTQDTEMGS